MAAQSEGRNDQYKYQRDSSLQIQTGSPNYRGLPKKDIGGKAGFFRPLAAEIHEIETIERPVFGETAVQFESCYSRDRLVRLC